MDDARSKLLDDPAALADLDPGRMLPRVEALADQVAQAIEQANALTGLVADGEVTSFFVAGMGGSGVAGELLQGYLGDRLRKPLGVHRDYRLPVLAGRGSFVAVVSYSGETAEALSAYREGRRRRLAMMALSSGGALAVEAKRDGVPWFRLPPGYPPRAALAFIFFPLLRLASLLGVAPPGEECAEVPGTLRELCGRYGPLRPARQNRAKELAIALWRRWPLIHSSHTALAGVGVRFRTQLAENAKVLAVSSCYPELAHNEVVGWDGPEEMTRNVTLIELIGGEETPESERVRQLVKEMALRRQARVEEARAEGQGRLARMFSLIALADFASVYLAFLNGRDPSSIGPIDELKARLREHPSTGQSSEGRVG